MTNNFWSGIRPYLYAYDGESCIIKRRVEAEKEGKKSQRQDPQEKSLSDAVREHDWEGVVNVVKHLEKRNTRLEKELEFYKSSDRALTTIKDISRRETFRHVTQESTLKDLNETLTRKNKELNREIIRLKKLGVFPWTEKRDTINYSSNRFGDLDMVSPAEAFEHKQNSEGEDL